MGAKPANHEPYTTKILLSNLHCPSCVRTVDDTLQHFGNEVYDVSTSTVAQTVTIKHSNELPATALAQALYDAGFDVQSMWEQHANQRISTFAASMLSPIVQPSTNKKASHAFSDFSCGLLQSPDQRRQHDAKHSAYCEQCAADGMSRADSQAHLTRSSSTYEAYDDKKTNDSVMVIAAKPVTKRTFKAVLAIDGMTCSACVGRVAEVLQAKPFVQDVNVNLLSNSATVVIDDATKAAELVEEIEDIGYDAKLESCEPLAAETAQQTSTDIDDLTQSRHLTIKVDGYHCPHCPEKVVQVLRGMGPEVKILEARSLSGLVTISYDPRPPQFTIRHIIRQIESADPAFSATVFRPPSLEERARKLQQKHRRHIAARLLLSVIVAIPTLIFGVIIMNLLSEQSSIRQYWMSPTVGQTPRVQWVLLPLATIVYLFAADMFHRRAVKEIYMMWRPSSKVPILRRFYSFGSMDMLLSLGTSVAYIGSIVIVIMSSLQKGSMDTVDTTTYFDAVVFLTMFLLCGRLLEAVGKAQTADAVTSLGNLRPAEALLMTTDEVSTSQSITQAVPIDQLEAGDVVLVPAGASPPCDGILQHGSTTINESSLTGESRPVAKETGDEVFAGTVNITSAIQVRVTGIGGTSLLDRIIDTVREGQSKRAPIERVADVLTGYFVPVIVLTAVLDWIIWLALGYTGRVPYVQPGTGGWVFWSLQFAIAVLVVACPCGIGLAAPTALFVGTGIAAKQGILVKGGGEAFQDASALDCVVFDKTGTITEGGSPRITDHHFFNNDSSSHATILDALHGLESASSHPLARAVKSFCEKQDPHTASEMQEIEEIAGKGMTGSCVVAGGMMHLFIGNVSMAQQCGVRMSRDACDRFDDWSSQGKTVMLIGSKSAHDERYTLDLMLAASDPIRAEAPAVIAALESRGIEVWLLSGDNEKTARVVAAQAGISAERVIAGVLPHEKADKIRYLQKRSVDGKHSWLKRGQSHRAAVAMVGDGINDAPALAAADVGIAMGSGSDTAISTASFVLLSSDLVAVLTLLKLSKAVLRRVKFNFGWAMGYNLIMLPIAAGVLFSAVSNGSHIRLDPVWASLAMALSSVSVVVSSLLLKTRLPVVGFRSRTHLAYKL